MPGKSANSGTRGIRRRDSDQRPPRVNNHRTDDANAFMPDPEGGPARIGDDLAENLAEEYLQAATQGADAEEDLDQVVPEEIGGPFIETSAAEEFAHDTDEANPLEAEAEPLPRPVAGLVSVPLEAGEEDSEENADQLAASERQRPKYR